MADEIMDTIGNAIPMAINVVQQWMLARTGKLTHYTKPMPFGTLCGTRSTLIIATENAQFDLICDRVTRRINTRDEHTTAFLVEDGHFDLVITGPGELIL